MPVISHLAPQPVFRFFEDLCAIPHGSGDTKKISDYCAEFARQRGLAFEQDALNNIIIFKPATAGYEQAPAVIVQGHLDMVTEKTPDSPIDFRTDGLQLRLEDDRVWAEGTTLGGDDGIAVAMALAILDSETIPHPALEAIFTVDEETGMEGAEGLDVTNVRGRLLLNLDSEDEGIFTVSCAGGARANLELPAETEENRLPCFRLEISGLIGGHSGVEIDKGRANAVQLLGRVLDAIGKTQKLHIVRAAGGLKDNAIPVFAEAVLALEDAAAAEAVCRQMQKAFSGEFAAADPGVRVTLEKAGISESALSVRSSERVCSLLTLMPNGIEDMSMDIPGLVQTSCNLGIFRADGTGIHASSSVRSSVSTRKAMLLARMEMLCGLLEGEMHVTGDYPAWEYRRDSRLREICCEAYRAQYGKEPRVEAIHAGLECGLFAGKLPGLDAVSFGPDLLDIHTPRETLSVSSVQRTWKLLLEILRRLK